MLDCGTGAPRLGRELIAEGRAARGNLLVTHTHRDPIQGFDADRQWFKSRQGLVARKSPREMALCAHAILAEDVLVVPDALADPRFADNPLVTGEPRLRFYAGAPLALPDGHRVGTLCLIDHRPRDLPEAQRDALRALARRVEVELASAGPRPA